MQPQVHTPLKYVGTVSEQKLTLAAISRKYGGAVDVVDHI